MSGPTFHFAGKGGGVSDHLLLLNIGVNTHAQIDTHIADASLHFTEASIDHTAIQNVGSNTHAQIDSHIADATLHFTVGSIDHTAIANIGTNSHAAIDSHIADGSIHYADAPADANDYVRRNNAWVQASYSTFGEYSGTFDASAGSFPAANFQGDWYNCTVAGTVDGQNFAVGDILVALVDSPSTTTFAGNWTIVPNISVTDHTLLTNIGVNTHAQIDTHIADSSIHFTEASIDHANILNVGSNTHAQIDAHIASTANPHTVTLQQAFDAGPNIASTTQALGIPTMTEVQRDALTPVTGQIIFNTDANQVNQYNGSGWTVPGGGLTTLQGAYDNDPTGAQILLDNVPNPFTVQASVSGTVISWLDDGGSPIFTVNNDPNTITANAGVQVVDQYLNSGGAASIIMNDTVSVPAFVGGGIQSLGTVTYTATTFIWALLQESKGYIANAGPGFAAFTLFNAIPFIRNGTNNGLVQALCLNVGIAHQATGANAVTTTQTIGVSFSPNTRALSAFGSMTKTTGDTGMRISPTHGTVGSSSINHGTIRGLWCSNPAVALFQSGAGTESMTAYIGVEIDAIPFGGNVTKRGIRSALAAASNTRFIEHTGTAESDHAGNFNLDQDFPNGLLRHGAGLDYVQGWVNGSSEFFQQVSTPAISQWRWSSPAADRVLLRHALANGEFNIQCDRFSLGQQSGAVGNQVGVFVAGARTATVGGEWSDFLLTQAANITIDAAMGLVAGWTINAPSISLGTGSVTTAVGLNVGGNPGVADNRIGVRIISNPSGGSGVNAALWVTAGRSQFDGIVRLPRNTDANRGAAGEVGRIIFNTDDGQLNIDDGTNWTLPDGTVT